MKNKTTSPAAPAEPANDDIREYAYHLYLKRGGGDGHDLDDWLEAKACLQCQVIGGAIRDPAPRPSGREAGSAPSRGHVLHSAKRAATLKGHVEP